jgi:hypothetical protein
MPPHPFKTPYWHPSRRKPLIFGNRPYRLWPKRKNPRHITNLETFTEAHRWADDRIKNYLEKRRPDWQHLSPAICRELETVTPRGFPTVDLFYANNNESRIRFAEIAIRHVEAHAALSGGEPVFFVTLMPNQFAVPEAEAGSVDVHAIRQWTRYWLAGFDFIGIVEAGLFPYFPTKYHPTVSWHVHLLVWGTNYRRLNQALVAVRCEFASLVPGAPSARIDILETPEDVILKVLYMLKAPMKQYTVSCEFREDHDPTTGEVSFEYRLRTQGEWLRTGQRVRMCRVMADKHLDQLLFGQEQGTDLRRAIVEEALRPFRRYEAKEAARRNRSRH